jgi:DHA2 family multidrug resistance protein-like MFS transporter
MPFTRVMARRWAPALIARTAASPELSSSTRHDHRKASLPPPQTPDDNAGLPEPRRTAAIAAVLAAMVLAVLDAGIVNVALPTIA